MRIRSSHFIVKPTIYVRTEEYTFMILPEYLIIFHQMSGFYKMDGLDSLLEKGYLLGPLEISPRCQVQFSKNPNASTFLHFFLGLFLFLCSHVVYFIYFSFIPYC